MQLFGLVVPKMYLWKKYFGNCSKFLQFNDGFTGILNILNYFGLSKQVTQVKVIKRDTFCVREIVCKSSEKGKKWRKHLRSIKKGYLFR